MKTWLLALQLSVSLIFGVWCLSVDAAVISVVQSRYRFAEFEVVKDGPSPSCNSSFLGNSLIDSLLSNTSTVPPPFAVPLEPVVSRGNYLDKDGKIEFSHQLDSVYIPHHYSSVIDVSPTSESESSLLHEFYRNLTTSHSLLGLLNTSESVVFPKFGNCSLPRSSDSKTFHLGSPFRELTNWFINLFQRIPAATGWVELNRFDLWHAHIFVRGCKSKYFASEHSKQGQKEKGIENEKSVLGILFHAQEYPNRNESEFPFNLGYCQFNSTLRYNVTNMAKRNFLYLMFPSSSSINDSHSSSSPKIESKLFMLASSKGGTEVPEGVKKVLGEAPLYTVYEDYLGIVLGDLYYLNDVGLGWIGAR
ncbi:hypothetical protein BKA69DRAFT_1041734 [Paraphysoderma sedebokerense]|nr:hypothetical protein BKA69DRAFT_1041734 [Paraphysoderma sedebokerense]